MSPLLIIEKIGYVAAIKYYSILTLFLNIILFTNGLRQTRLVFSSWWRN